MGLSRMAPDGFKASMPQGALGVVSWRILRVKWAWRSLIGHLPGIDYPSIIAGVALLQVTKWIPPPHRQEARVSLSHRSQSSDTIWRYHLSVLDGAMPSCGFILISANVWYDTLIAINTLNMICAILLGTDDNWPHCYVFEACDIWQGLHTLDKWAKNRVLLAHCQVWMVRLTAS